MSRPIQTLPHVQPPRARRKARIASIMAAALVISWGAPAADAYWQTLSSNNGGAGADAIVAVAALTASASAGAASVSWAPSTTAGGKSVSGYTVARYSLAGGEKVAAGGACGGTIATLTCSEAALPAGTWYYTVTPVLAAWAGPESARSEGVAGDSAAPIAPTLSVPAFLNTLDVGNVNVDVTAEAGASVKVTVVDTPPVGTPQQTLTQNLTANGSVQTISFNLSTFSNGTITYTAVATDAAGNVSNPGVATSTKDTVAPTAKVTLGNDNGTAEKGDKVVITYSETMNASSICSAWTSNSLNYTINGNDLVTIQISPAKILTVTATGCSTLRIGDVALDGMYTGTAAPLVFGGSGGNVSSIAWNFTAKTLTLTLGKLAPGTQSLTSVGTGSPTVVPPSGVKDVAGNQAISAAPDAASRF